MAAINFGYTISKPRAIDLDRNNLRKSDEILREMPELQTCIGCGACTALGDEQVHVVRQMPPGLPPRDQHPGRGDADQT